MGQILGPDSIGSLTHSSGTITLGASVLTIGGQQFRPNSLSYVVSGLDANSTYKLYAVMSSGSPIMVADLSGYSSWKEVGEFSTDDSGDFRKFSDLDEDWFVDLAKIPAPYTTIKNRAKMVDLSKDLLPRFGVDRHQIQDLIRLETEYGPNEEPVYKPVNDWTDSVRFYGDHEPRNTVRGAMIYSRPSSTAFMEFTFYGTGLNILQSYLDSNSRQFTPYVDGVAQSPISYTGDAVISERNYSCNMIIPVVSGLTLGLHTVRIVNSGSYDMRTAGYEVLNEGSDLVIPEGYSWVGSERRSNFTEGTSAYNSDFETGSIGTKGGRVVVYQKQDGSVAKSVRPVFGTTKQYPNTDHVEAEEEVIRAYSYREFGAGRGDDHSTVTYNSSAAEGFVIDDGSTSLVSTDAISYTFQGYDVLTPDSSGQSDTFTFIGTGLDIVGHAIGSDDISSMTVSVDGGATFNLGTVSTGVDKLAVLSIVSGLPYGTHTVRFNRVSGNRFGFMQFLVYGPKKPELPNKAIELSEYFLVADYSATATGTSITDNLQKCTGVISKGATREFLYGGSGWSVDLNTSVPQGARVKTITANDFIEYSFFGTGIVTHMIYYSSNTPFTVSIDGSLDDSGTVLCNATNSGGGTYQVTTTTTHEPARIEFSGLSLGWHKLRIDRPAGPGYITLVGLDIITPVHCIKDNGPHTTQNSLAIGSNALRDLRQFDEKVIPSEPVSGKSVGITSGISTVADAPGAPAYEMVHTIYLDKPSVVDVKFASVVRNSSTGGAASYLNILINGQVVVLKGIGEYSYTTDSRGRNFVTVSRTLKLEKGYHTIVGHFYSEGATTTILEWDSRYLEVKVIK